MRPGAMAPKGLVPDATPGSSPIPPPPPLGCKGPARSPARRGYLEPGPDPASSGRSTSRAATSVTAAAVTAAALSAAGPAVRASPPPRGSLSPRPIRRVPLPGAPPRCARGSPAAESAPTRLRLRVTSRRRFLAPPSGAGPRGGRGADGCLGAGRGRPPTRARRQAVSRAWRPPPKRQQSRAPSFRASCPHPARPIHGLSQ